MKLLAMLLCFVGMVSGCAVNLPFNTRLAYSHVSEAKKLASNKLEPTSIEWSPADFLNRVDVQGASGFVGGGSQTRIPTGVALANRITEALDVSIGIDSSAKNLLELNIISAESKFEYSAGMFNVTPGIDYGWCSLDVAFNYNGTKWNQKFIAEERDTTIGGTSQTGILEKVWDDIALQVAKNVSNKIEQSAKVQNYKGSEAYQLRLKEKAAEEAARIKAAAEEEAKKEERVRKYYE